METFITIYTKWFLNWGQTENAMIFILTGVTASLRYLNFQPFGPDRPSTLDLIPMTPCFQLYCGDDSCLETNSRRSPNLADGNFIIACHCCLHCCCTFNVIFWTTNTALCRLLFNIFLLRFVSPGSFEVKKVNFLQIASSDSTRSSYPCKIRQSS